MKFFPETTRFHVVLSTCKGKAAHGGTRYEGVSAIEKKYVCYRTCKKARGEKK